MVNGNCQQSTRGWTTIVAWCVLWGLIGCEAATVQAMTGFNLTLPAGPPMVGKKPSGLQLQIHSNWVDGSGYRPVTIELRTATPVRANRQLHLQLTPNNWQGARWEVETDIELSQGSSVATSTILMPQRSPWQVMEIKAWEDGRVVEDLSSIMSTARTSSNYGWTEAFPSIIIIDSDAPAPSELADRLSKPGNLANEQNLFDFHVLLPLMNQQVEDVQTIIQANSDAQIQAATATANGTPTTPQRPSDFEILRTMQSLSQVMMTPPRALPTDWRAYSSVDWIFTSLTDLQILQQQHPDSFRAIVDYVSGGGHLLVTDAGGDFSRLTAIDQLLKAKSAQLTTEEASDEPWRRLRAESYGRPLQTVLPQDPNQYMVNGMPQNWSQVVTQQATATTESEDDKPRPLPAESEDAFQTRDLSMGRVIAAKSSTLRDIEPLQWGWLLEDLKSERWRWYRRMGMSSIRENSEFWDLMIPGVGAAPVYAFLAIITGFVILIGPVNYVWLSRSKRLYLLLVTVPVCAALITGALLGYALIRDGLGTRARLISFSDMDNDGKVVSWSRQTYYAAVAPSEGLVYPNTACVFALDAFPDETQRVSRTMHVGETHQRFTAGFLPSRTMTQNVVINQEKAKPLVTIERNAAGKLELINRSEQRLTAVVIYDNGSPHLAQTVAPASEGGRTVAEPITTTDLSAKLRMLVEPLEPRVPVGFTTPRTMNRWYYYGNSDGNQPPPSFISGLMMTSIQEVLAAKTPSGRVWIALVPLAPPFVPMGISSADQTPGIHFVRGSW